MEMRPAAQTADIFYCLKRDDCYAIFVMAKYCLHEAFSIIYPVIYAFQNKSKMYEVGAFLYHVCFLKKKHLKISDICDIMNLSESKTLLCFMLSKSQNQQIYYSIRSRVWHRLTEYTQ